VTPRLVLLVALLVVASVAGAAYTTVVGRTTDLIVSLIANALFIPLGAGLTLFYLTVGRDKVAQRKYRFVAINSPERVLPGATENIYRIDRKSLYSELRLEIVNNPPGVPHVVIGPAGSGKTTTLQVLISHLASHGLTPVVIRADHHDDLSQIESILETSYLAVVDDWLRSASDGDRLWRSVKSSKSVVAIIDGIDDWRARHGFSPADALLGLKQAIQDTSFRAVVALRSDDTEIANSYPTFELEPLSLSESDIDHIVEAFPVGVDNSSKQKFVQTLQVTDALKIPLFLELATQMLAQPDVLEKASSMTEIPGRLVLLDGWLNQQRQRAKSQSTRLVDQYDDQIRRLSEIAFCMTHEGRLELPSMQIEDLIKRHITNTDSLLPSSWRSIVTTYQFGRLIGLLDVSALRYQSGQSFKFRHSLLQVYLTFRYFGENPGAVEVALTADASAEMLLALEYYFNTDNNWPRACDLQRKALKKMVGARSGITSWLSLISRLGRLDEDAESIFISASRRCFSGSDDTGKVELINIIGAVNCSSHKYSLLWDLAKKAKLGVATAAGRKIVAGGSESFNEIQLEIVPLVRRGIGVRLEEVGSWDDFGHQVTLLSVFVPMWAELATGSAGTELEYLTKVFAEMTAAGQLGGVEASIVDGMRRALAINSQSTVWRYIDLLVRNVRTHDARIYLAHMLAEFGRNSPKKVDARRLLAVLVSPGEHPFVKHAARLALKHLEGEAVPGALGVWQIGEQRQPKAAARLGRQAHQLLADSYLLLLLENQKVSSDENYDRQVESWKAKTLPWCLSESHNRSEFFTNCHETCHFQLCPLDFDFASQRRASPFSDAFLVRAAELALTTQRPWSPEFRGKEARQFWYRLGAALSIHRGRSGHNNGES
jgi:hypothetical protein